MLLSLERLLLIYFPFRKLNGARKRSNIIVASVLSILAFGFYSFSIFTSELKYIDDIGVSCQPKDEWFRFVQSMSLIDSISTFIVPFIVVFLINFAILIKIFQFRQKKGIHTFSLSEIFT